MYEQFMQNAQAMQAQLEEMKAKIEQQEYEGISGAGLVRVIMNGAGDLRKLSIDPSLFSPDEAETLPDLIIAAFSDAKSKWKADSTGYMSGMMNQLGIKL